MITELLESKIKKLLKVGGALAAGGAAAVVGGNKYKEHKKNEESLKNSNNLENQRQTNAIARQKAADDAQPGERPKSFSPAGPTGSADAAQEKVEQVRNITNKIKSLPDKAADKMKEYAENKKSSLANSDKLEKQRQSNLLNRERESDNKRSLANSDKLESQRNSNLISRQKDADHAVETKQRDTENAERLHKFVKSKVEEFKDKAHDYKIHKLGGSAEAASDKAEKLESAKKAGSAYAEKIHNSIKGKAEEVKDKIHDYKTNPFNIIKKHKIAQEKREKDTETLENAKKMGSAVKSGLSRAKDFLKDKFEDHKDN